MDPVSKTPTKPIDYAALSAGYGALTGALLVAARARDAEAIRPGELPVMGLATFALAKLVAKEKVDSWVREPFLEERPNGERRPKGKRMRYAVGELLVYALRGLVERAGPRRAADAAPAGGAGRPARPRAGRRQRLAATGFTTLCAEANVVQKRTRMQARPATTPTSRASTAPHLVLGALRDDG